MPHLTHKAGDLRYRRDNVFLASRFFWFDIHPTLVYLQLPLDACGFFGFGVPHSYDIAEPWQHGGVVCDVAVCSGPTQAWNIPLRMGSWGYRPISGEAYFFLLNSILISQAVQHMDRECQQ